MSFLAAVADPRVYHVLSYGTYLGSTFFQSFVGGVTAYKSLPRPMFGRLQEATFPVYFSLQSVFGAVMLLTYPGQNSLVNGRNVRVNTGMAGAFAPANRWTAFVPLATTVVTSLLNLFVLGPATTRAMKARHHQETRDGKKSYDAGPHSPEMQQLNKRFGMLHSVSTISNLAGFGSAIWYGVMLAKCL